MKRGATVSAAISGELKAPHAFAYRVPATIREYITIHASSAIIPGATTPSGNNTSYLTRPKYGNSTHPSGHPPIKSTNHSHDAAPASNTTGTQKPAAARPSTRTCRSGCRAPNTLTTAAQISHNAYNPAAAISVNPPQNTLHATVGYRSSSPGSGGSGVETLG